MEKRRLSFFATAALIMAVAVCSIGTPKSRNPCDEAFLALTTAFTGTRPGVIGDGVINVWSANPDGSASHPKVKWGAKGNVSWREVASFMRFNCGDQYEVNSLATDQNERFYDDGVIVRKKTAQNFSLPETNVNGMGAFFSTLAALLGLGTLGVGVKKLVGA